MKQKTLYIFFAILVIIIMVRLFISRETIRIQPVPKPEPIAIAPQEENAPFEQMQPFSSPEYIIRPAVTIINPRPNEKENPAAIPEQKPNKLEEPQASVEPGQSSVSPESQPQEKPASGITKIGKYPAEREKQEMDSRGTIMF